MPCLFPAWAIPTFPLAVILNLFFAELLVFSLGIIATGYTNINIILQQQLLPIKAE
jgi:hypothetical protein